MSGRFSYEDIAKMKPEDIKKLIHDAPLPTRSYAKEDLNIRLVDKKTGREEYSGTINSHEAFQNLRERVCDKYSSLYWDWNINGYGEAKLKYIHDGKVITKYGMMILLHNKGW